MKIIPNFLPEKLQDFILLQSRLYLSFLLHLTFSMGLYSDDQIKQGLQNGLIFCRDGLLFGSHKPIFGLRLVEAIYQQPEILQRISCDGLFSIQQVFPFYQYVVDGDFVEVQIALKHGKDHFDEVKVLPYSDVLGNQLQILLLEALQFGLGLIHHQTSELHQKQIFDLLV